MTTAKLAPSTSPARSDGVLARLAEMLAATDQFVTWWGAHRAWPANERARER